jgi:hypothetical protein
VLCVCVKNIQLTRFQDTQGERGKTLEMQRRPRDTGPQINITSSKQYLRVCFCLLLKANNEAGRPPARGRRDGWPAMHQLAAEGST